MADSEEITVTIKSSVDKKYELTIPSNLTVIELKDRVAIEADVPAASQRLIYSGRVLKDGDTLDSYKIKSGHTIHLVKSANARAASASSTGQASASASATNNQGTISSNSNSNAVPTNIASGQGSFNPLADLTGARYAGYAQLPSESMFGPDGGLSLPSEEDMDRLLDDPTFQQGLNEMLRNPQMVDYMINQNPQLRAMGPMARQMLQSDQFRQMLTNPETRRQMREMQRMFGGGLGGFGGQQQQQSAFPAPGGNTNDDDLDENASTATTTNNNTSSTQQPANPFAAMFPGGSPFGGANPFAAFANSNASSNNSTTNASSGGFPQVDPALFQSLFGGAGGLGGGLFGGFPGGTPAATAAPVDNRPPEERYESQLRQLNDMGFNDFESNVRALRRSGGSVQGAVENLLNGI